MSNEKDVEKLQAKNAELRRKLDDAQAAMHELGRENQALQITQTKAMGRKWTDDKEVLDCMSCSKAFSLAVRKVCILTTYRHLIAVIRYCRCCRGVVEV